MNAEELVDQTLLAWHKPSAQAALKAWYERLGNEWETRRDFYTAVVEAANDPLLSQYWALLLKIMDCTEQDAEWQRLVDQANALPLDEHTTDPLQDHWEDSVLTDEDWLAIGALLGDDLGL